MQRKEFTAIEIIQFMTHNSLLLFDPKHSKASITQLNEYKESLKKERYKKGIIFVSPSKDELMEGKGIIITSYEGLNKKINQLSHWTPNIYTHGTYVDFKKRIIKGHTNDNLKQVNVVAMDIDTKDIDLYPIFIGCDEVGLPRPNVLLETPKGFQIFWVLERPFYANRNTAFKGISTVEKIAYNMRKALSNYLPIDMACSNFGFYRIPNEHNVIYFDDCPANNDSLKAWSIKQSKENNRAHLSLVVNNDESQEKAIHTEWYNALINSTEIAPGEFVSGRNNTLFTLALANYQSGVSFEAAYNTLDQFNSQLDYPLSIQEFNRTIKSAYSGRYDGPSKEYVEFLIERWTDSKVKYKSNFKGWYKFKKNREDRVRSHYSEWEEDLFKFLEKHTNEEQPFLEISMQQLSKLTNIPLSSLKALLKRNNKVVKRTVGKGRAAKSFFATNRMLFRHVLFLRKQQLQQEQMSFVELLPMKTLVKEDIPTLAQLFYQYRKLLEPLHLITRRELRSG